MPNASFSADQQALLNAVPENGEIKYEDLMAAVAVSGNRRAIRQFHDMRRSGALQVFLDPNPDPDARGKVMFVARPGYTRPAQSGASAAPATTGGVTNVG